MRVVAEPSELAHALRAHVMGVLEVLIVHVRLAPLLFLLNYLLRVKIGIFA